MDTIWDINWLRARQGTKRSLLEEEKHYQYQPEGRIWTMDSERSGDMTILAVPKSLRIQNPCILVIKRRNSWND